MSENSSYKLYGLKEVNSLTVSSLTVMRIICVPIIFLPWVLSKPKATQKRLYFSATLTASCGYVTKFLPMACEQSVVYPEIKLITLNSLFSLPTIWNENMAETMHMRTMSSSRG